MWCDDWALVSRVDYHVCGVTTGHRVSRVDYHVCGVMTGHWVSWVDYHVCGVTTGHWCHGLTTMYVV